MRRHPAWTAAAIGVPLAVAAAVLETYMGSSDRESAPQVLAAGTLERSASALVAAADTELREAAGQLLMNQPPVLAANPDAKRLLAAAGTAVDAFRPEEWEVGALGASLGEDPTAAFEFVRDTIAFDPYPAVLRGAQGALAARAGNAWDRALLLKALLVEAGLTTRLAFATLDPATAAALVKRAHRPPVRILSKDAPSSLRSDLIESIAARARRDDAALRLALGHRLTELGVDDTDLVRQDVSQHVWVQLLRDNIWIDLDPTLPDAKIGEVLAIATGSAPDVAKEHQHTVIVRIVAEFLTEGALSETVSLERELPSATAADQYLLLGFVPEVGGKGGQLLGGATSSNSFVPTLWVDGERQTGRPLVPTAAGGTGGGFDLFGGGEDSARELVSLHIEVETRVLGRVPTVARHILLDRVRPEARASSPIATEGLQPTGAVGRAPRHLSGFHHLMISTGGASPYAMAELRLWALDASLRSVDAFSRPRSLDRHVWPMWAHDLMLVEGSERVMVSSLDALKEGRAYVAEPRVFLASWFPEPAGVDGMSRETDLLIDSVRVLLPEPIRRQETVAWQLHYGALQSALETETALRMAVAWDADDRSVFSTSIAMGPELTVLSSSDVQRPPVASAEAMKKALRGGALVIAPGDVATATAWWTVARSGLASAIVDPGAGMSSIRPRQPGGVNKPANHGAGGGKPKPPIKREPPKVNPTDTSNRPNRKPPANGGRWKPLQDYYDDLFEDAGKPSPGTEYLLVLGVSGAVMEAVSYFGTEAVKKVVASSADALGPDEGLQ